MSANPWNWKAITLGAVDVLLLFIFTAGLTSSVTGRHWITAQASLVGIVIILGISAWQLRRMILAHAAKTPHLQTTDYGVATIIRLLQFTAFGVAAILLYAIQTGNWSPTGKVAEIASVGLLTAGASLAAGAFLGFLFGVPKTSQAASPDNGTPKPTSSTGNSDDDDENQKQPYGANTNLEQISDWLTKTIVGVSLVELTKLPPFLSKVATFVAAGLDGGDSHGTKAVALVIMVYFVSTGFLTGYLWTRMELTRAFNASALGRRIGRLEKQSKTDAAALVNVDRWLNHHDQSQMPEQDLAGSITAASSLIKARIFLTTEEFREKPPVDDKDAIRAASKLGLPIFKALVEADVTKTFHRNRGQYAFTLMTQPVSATTPDWSAALAMVEEAIAVRDRAREPGWKEYEFARAVCKIHLNPAAKQDAMLKANIDADLQASPQPAEDRRRRLDLDGVAAAWLAVPPAVGG